MKCVLIVLSEDRLRMVAPLNFAGGRQMISNQAQLLSVSSVLIPQVLPAPGSLSEFWTLAEHKYLWFVSDAEIFCYACFKAAAFLPAHTCVVFLVLS